MLNNIRQQLTYRRFIGITGGFIALAIGVLWVRGEKLFVFGSEYEPEPVLYVLGVAAGLGISILTLIYPRLFSDELIFPIQDKRFISEKQRRDNRTKMLDLVEKIWIEGFLNNVLNELSALQLDMNFAEPDKVLKRRGMEDYRLQNSSAIHRIFADLQRKIVILGEPGSGKTVTLLQLARELIAEARADQKKPIPIVLALSSWAAERLPFENWLIEELRLKYGLSTKVASDLVESEQLLYLFDGLDEVVDEHRKACLKAIKTFTENQRPVLYALTSRRKEFEVLKIRLRTIGEIILQPLTSAQVADYIAEDAFDGLRAVMVDMPLLREFAETPFMLNTLAYTMHRETERNIRLLVGQENSSAVLRDHLLEIYVEKRLHTVHHPFYRDLRKTRTRLQWLAAQLVRHERTDFYIEDLQVTYLPNIKSGFHYRAWVRLAVWLAISVAGVVIGGSVLGMVDGIAIGLAVGLLVGLWAGSYVLLREKIETVDQLKWAFSVFDLALGFALFGFSTNFTFGIVFGFAYALANGQNYSEVVSLRVYPNSGIHRSIANVIYTVLPLSFAFGLAFSVIYGLGVSLVAGVSFGLMYGLRTGGRSVIRHLILRLFLAHGSSIPYWHYDLFLDYSVELVILRRIGGSYRFVHDYLQKYLAEKAFASGQVTRELPQRGRRDPKMPVVNSQNSSER